MLYVSSGSLGTDPARIYKYFRAKKVKYYICDGFGDFISKMLNGYFGIVSFTNKNFFRNGIHTFFLYYDAKKKEYVVFNGYDAATNCAKRYKKIQDIYKNGGKSFFYGYACK